MTLPYYFCVRLHTTVELLLLLYLIVNETQFENYNRKEKSKNFWIISIFLLLFKRKSIYKQRWSDLMTFKKNWSKHHFIGCWNKIYRNWTLIFYRLSTTYEIWFHTSLHLLSSNLNDFHKFVPIFNKSISCSVINFLTWFQVQNFALIYKIKQTITKSILYQKIVRW